jgi:hypothetical protein
MKDNIIDSINVDVKITNYSLATKKVHRYLNNPDPFKVRKKESSFKPVLYGSCSHNPLNMKKKSRVKLTPYSLQLCRPGPAHTCGMA